MLQKPAPRFLCFPSVVCAGTETEVTIFPRDISRVFRAEWEYELCVVDLNGDQEDYHTEIPHDHPFTVENGCLKFTHFFESEQEYSIRFRKKGSTVEKLRLYAVEKDLYSLRPLKGDLHSHTYYSDGSDGIAATPADYREAGFDFFSLTDHNRMYPSQLAAELYDGIPLGLHIMSGEEVHTPGSILHIVHAGGTKSVCEQYIHHTEAYEAAVDAIAETLPHVPEQYRRRIAMAKWACEQIHQAGGIAIFAHPFWVPNRYNLSPEFRDLLFQEKMFDALEVMGGIQAKNNNMQLALWMEQAAKGNPLAPVGSSDSHDRTRLESSFPNRFTVVFAKENSTEAILEAIRTGYTLAGERPDTSEREVRFYGSLRLVQFAQFLAEVYFPETQRLCVGEGVLMRRYAAGEPVGEILSALANTVSDFYQKFYGLCPAPTLPPERLAYLDKCLDLQRTVGPVTKGSSLFLYGGNECRY